MDIDFRDLAPRERYKLIVGGVVPRPIALVTTIGEDGSVNAAPFSFFNAMCNDPPALAVGVNQPGGAALKDTARNIVWSREFVVNMVDEALAPRMNLCETEFAPTVDELAVAGLTASPSCQVRAPCTCTFATISTIATRTTFSLTRRAWSQECTVAAPMRDPRISSRCLVSPGERRKRCRLARQRCEMSPNDFRVRTQEFS